MSSNYYLRGFPRANYDHADKSYLRPRIPGSEIAAWIAFVAFLVGLLMIWSWALKRDEAQARAEWLSRACQPYAVGQMAASEMLPDGSIRCAITERKRGMKIVQRMEM